MATRGVSENTTPDSQAIITDVRRLEFRTRRILNADLIGQYRSAFRGSGLVYSDLREYQAGDEVRNIHWKASARTGKVFVKSYDEDRLLNIMLVIDISRSTLYGAPQSRHLRAFEFAALTAMLAQKNEDAVGLCLFSDGIEEFMRPKRSRTQIQRVILSLMEHRELRPSSDMSGAIDYLNRHIKRRGVVFLVSDFFCPPFESQLRKLAYRHDVIGVLLEDPVEKSLPEAGIVEFADAETGELRLFDTASPLARENLRQQQLQHRRKVAETCAAAQADFMSLTEDPLRPLVDLMRRRARRIGSGKALPDTSLSAIP